MDTIKGFIFDLDGTVYLGNEMIKDANQVIDYLQENDKKILFLTNKTIESREKYVKKLQGFQMNVSLEQILNPTVTLINYLRKYHPNSVLYIIGEPIIKDELTAAGFQIAEKPEHTDIVILSWYRDFHYDHLNFAYQAVKHGAVTIATNPDRTCPLEDGDVPDCAGMIGALEGVTGKPIDIQIGKPSVLTVEAAMDVIQLLPEECLMIGDRLETDIRMGVEAGMKTAVVLTGITTATGIVSAPWEPDYVLESVADILNHDMKK